MMHKAFLAAELDKLLQYPQYSKVLHLDTTPPEPVQQPPKKKTRLQSKPGVSAVKKAPVQEGETPDPLDKLKGWGQQQAEAYN